MDSSKEQNFTSEELPLDLAERLDRLADEFERMFNAGQQPCIEKELEGHRDLPKEHLLPELIRLEWELRRKTGQDPSVAEYVSRFPQDERLIREVLQSRQETLFETRAWSGSDTGGSRERIGRFEVIRPLGSGGFGVVTLARDPQLDRLVAIKNPVRTLVQTQGQVDEFLQEARSAAQLRHPALVSVFDVQVQDEQPFIVYEYVRGEDLRSWIGRHKPSFQQIIRMLIEIVDALRHAHERGIIHCDLKLSNVLVDQDGFPHVADFGLSRHEAAARGQEGQLSGTPAIMAPEQIEGSQFVDPRTDIWAVGVMMFELLVGQRPFVANSRQELFATIRGSEPRSPRLLDVQVPVELDRICMKCLSKSPAERYATAGELRCELESWLAESESDQNPRHTLVRRQSAVLSKPTIIPRGLRAYTGSDAAFFLELLPGPRNQAGLPDSVAFWKERLECREEGEMLPVGLIYGPSGSGKTSFVQAGLIPQLDQAEMLALHCRVSDGGWLVGLKRQLERRLPECTPGSSLDGLFKQWQAQTPRRKLVLFLDQFEQWLHQNHQYQESELVRALHQCDGQSLQVVLIVRDDFFTSVNLLFQALELPLREGQNYALISRFPLNHARHVLELLGRGYGALSGTLNDSNRAFISQAVEQISEDGTVIGVRVALLAEMMKHRAWVPGSLEGVGGVDGIGVDYLETMICGEGAAPHRRAYAATIQQVLAQLVPPANSSIRGAAKTAEQLRQAVDCQDTREWQEVMQTLDQELRLVTPVDSAGPDKELSSSWPAAEEGSSSPEPRIQLTHDYLVPVLHAWLAKKQLETRQGRAALKLQEFASMWQQKPESRFLPGFLEWLELLLWTTKRQRNESQAAVMRAASRMYLLRLLVIGGVITVLAAGIHLYLADREATEITARLAMADFKELPAIAEEVKQHQRWVVPKLLRTVDDYAVDSREQLKVSLCLLPYDQSQWSRILQRLPAQDGDDMSTIRDMIVQGLTSKGGQEKNDLWKMVDAYAERRSPDLLKVTSLVAGLDPDNLDKWSLIAEHVVTAMIGEESLKASYWTELHTPVAQHLVPPLRHVFLNRANEYTVPQVSLATDILRAYAAHSLEDLAELIMVASEEQFNKLFSRLERHGPAALEPFERELLKENSPQWNDIAYIATLEEIEAEIGDSITQAEGWLTEDFGICQALPYNQFAVITEQLKRFQFRPARVRPYVHDGQILCAAIWRRDGGRFHVQLDMSREEISDLGNVVQGALKAGETDEAGSLVVAVSNRDSGETSGLIPIELSGYSDAGGEERFCLLWGEDRWDLKQIQLYAGVPASEQWICESDLAQQNTRFLPSLHYYTNAQGERRTCGIVSHNLDQSAVSFRRASTTWLETHEDLNRILWDINVSMVSEPESADAFFSQVLKDWDAFENANDWIDAGLRERNLPEAAFSLGEFDRCREHCKYGKHWKPHLAERYQFRSRLHAMEGDRANAFKELAKFERLCINDAKILSEQAMVAAHFGDEAEYVERLEELAAEQLGNVEAYFQLAAMYGGCSRVYAETDQATAAAYREKALGAVEHLAQLEGVDWIRMDRNANLESIRSEPRYKQLRNRAGAQAVYSGVHCTSQRFESAKIHGVSLAEHQLRSEELAAEGYRPVAISVDAVRGEMLAASVWHRPLITETQKEGLAFRQANAAVALFKLGSAEAVWPLLEFRPDPRLRTRIIHLLKRTNCDPTRLVDRLQVHPGSRHSGDVSRRRALVLALGEYEPVQLDAELVSRILLDWYRNDIDAGIHGACEWVLRKWGYEAEMDKINAELATGKPEGGRQWYRMKSADHTFSVIEGPVEFVVGTPPLSIAMSDLRTKGRVRFRLQRSFAIATLEVTAQQLEDAWRAAKLVNNFESKTSWDDNCGVGGTNLKVAWLYCEFLNFREEIPEAQWPVKVPFDDKPLILAENYLSRQGYRLPTAAEWEFACRAGTVTKRYFGHSEDWIEQYAWHGRNAGERSWPVGQLKPNDLGLFDMLGNVQEWNLEEGYSKYGIGPVGDDIEFAHRVDAKRLRVTRGGAFWGSPLYIAAVNSRGYYPFVRQSGIGIRIARTMPASED